MASLRAASTFPTRGTISRILDRNLESVMLASRPCPWRRILSSQEPKRAITYMAPQRKRRPDHSDTRPEQYSQHRSTDSAKEPFPTRSTAAFQRPFPVNKRPLLNTRPSRPGFQSRLQFLEGAMQDDRQHNHHNRMQSPSQYTQASRKSAAVKKSMAKRYRPGFKPGDFMCPQCGSHNFRPPEYDLDGFLEPAATITTTAIDKRVELNGSGASPTAKSTFSTTSPNQLQKDSPHNSQSDEHLSRTQWKRCHMLRRQYPIGATAHCFECGFESSYEIHLPPTHTFSESPQQASSTEESSLSKETETSTNTTSKEPVTTSTVIRHDLRLGKPRDYICPQCLTVNFNRRIHCVGCGSLNPTIAQRIEQGVR